MFAKLLFLALLVSSLDALEHDLVVHSAPADDIVPESPGALTAVQEEPFENENTGRDANSEVTNDSEDADIEDADTEGSTDEEDVDTNSPLVSAVQGDVFESAGEDGKVMQEEDFHELDQVNQPHPDEKPTEMLQTKMGCWQNGRRRAWHNWPWWCSAQSDSDRNCECYGAKTGWKRTGDTRWSNAVKGCKSGAFGGITLKRCLNNARNTWSPGWKDKYTGADDACGQWINAQWGARRYPHWPWGGCNTHWARKNCAGFCLNYQPGMRG